MKNNPVEFNHTSFYNGWSATYGKTPIKLALCLDFSEEGHFMELSLFTGMDKMYRIGDIGNFLEALEKMRPIHFGKNFIFEPDRMYFEPEDKKILEFISNLGKRRVSVNQGLDSRNLELHTDTVNLTEPEREMFLDLIWEDIGNLRFIKGKNKILFEKDVPLTLSVEKEEDSNLLYVDYSEYGDFVPVTVNFKYIACKDFSLIAKLPENKREIFINLYPCKNEENIVAFKIAPKDKKLFQKNFIEKYRREIQITIDSAVEQEMMDNTLLSRVYFDVAEKGIVSKIEFCYGEQIINPLEDKNSSNSFREYSGEKEVTTALKTFGFREYGRLFLLDDVEKIINLLTGDLKALKKISQIYYSADFKKLHVRNLNIESFSLSEDGSLIHMNINLENVSDEELLELLEDIKSGKKYYRLKNGSIVNLNTVESSRFIDLINSLQIDKESIHDGIFEIPLNRGLYINQYLKEKGLEQVQIDSRLGGLIKRISDTKEVQLTLGESVNGILRDYQREGVRWLKTMAGYSFGGILADDMGLGKTLQVLVFISDQRKNLPCLAVVPTSIVYNWREEAKKFVPELKVLAITGTKEKRELMINTCNQYDLVITSYGALKNDLEQYRKINFSYLFVDEAQNIKNPMTLNANAVKSLKAECCFAMTGTPIENRLMELWSIFDFIMPGYLFNRNEFALNYEEPIMKNKNQAKMGDLSNLVKPFILRRLKKDVLSELPEKIEINSLSEMTEKQKKLYAAYYKDLKKELEIKIIQSGIERNQIAILSALTRLRQICAHPGTFIDNYDGGSGKLEQAMEIITEALPSGHSILLFSQFTKMLKIIRTELERNHINYYYLDGTMNPEERFMEIDNFNSDKEAVFLISLKAGGTGLNLTKADIVIQFDPWWNPAVEIQASDRAHRMGQKNVVQVYKLLTEGTIEEKIAQLQEKKKDLIESIIQPGENFLNKIGEEELKELWGIE
ncbi:MAG: SNF2-related protein [Anaerocolumna sp.]